MTLSPNIGPQELEQYREYLMTIADLQIEPVLRRKLDASDVVQQTMLEAHARLNDFRGSTSAELAGWLKRILLNNLVDCVRAFRRERRDVARERSLDDSLNRSSLRLEACLAAEQSSPSLKVSRDEEGLQLSEALSRLPDTQREALVLQHWHGWSIDQIAEQMGRSRAAVAGLLKRGLKGLREEMKRDTDARDQ
jgi:RNA polymerase sigma-70 factor, ECF subfamily